MKRERGPAFAYIVGLAAMPGQQNRACVTLRRTAFFAQLTAASPARWIQQGHHSKELLLSAWPKTDHLADLQGRAKRKKLHGWRGLHQAGPFCFLYPDGRRILSLSMPKETFEKNHSMVDELEQHKEEALVDPGGSLNAKAPH